MPSESVYRDILRHHRLEFAVADAERRLYDYSPGLLRLTHARGSGPARGRRLEDLFDELVGLEKDWAAVLRGALPIMTVEKIVRQIAGQTCYLTLTLTAFNAGFLLIVADVTAAAALEQRVTQQRNELDLLAYQLAEARARLDDLLHRYISSAVADHLIANPQAGQPGGERREISALFADLRGFTAWAETQPPETVFETLNAHLTRGLEIIHTESGTVDKIMGDGLMGVWNAPHLQPDHARRAARAARALAALPKGPTGLQFGVGFATGWAMVGSLGTQQFLNYTVIGDVVNQAQRLQELAKAGQALTNDATAQWLQLADEPHRLLGARPLRGRRGVVQIYDLSAPPPDATTRYK
jgi:class 3 adenylate cyclase